MAIFGKQGYTKIAKVLKEARGVLKESSYLGIEYGNRTIEDVTDRLADLFERDSRMFDRQRFYRESGSEESIPMREVREDGTRTN